MENTTIYSWSWHESPATTVQLRRLKRELFGRLTMFHLFDMSRCT
jgi:hypothetical protein